MTATESATRDEEALLAGVTVPIVTTVDGDGRPDPEAMIPLLRAVSAAGISRIMLAGGNGEGPLIPAGQLGTFATEVAPIWRAMGDRQRLLVNVTAPGTADVLLRCAAVEGAAPDALVLSPPFYFRHRDDEVVAHYAALEITGRQVVVYNTPRYATPMTPAVLEQVLGLPFVVGIKDSSGDPELFAAILSIAARIGVGVAQGDETTAVTALTQGADGIVPGVANLVPAAAHRLYRSVRNQAMDDATAAQAVLTAVAGIHRIRPGVPSVKAVLGRLGLSGTALMPPLIACTDDETAELIRYLAPWREHLADVGDRTIAGAQQPNK